MILSLINLVIMQCVGTTLSGSKCQKVVKNKLYCHLHRSNSSIIEEEQYLTHLFIEIWNEIVNNLRVVELGNLSLVNKYFYNLVVNRFDKPYYAVIIDSNNINIAGNDDKKHYFWFRPNHNACEYIIDDVVQPMQIPLIEVNNLPLQPLVHDILNYKQFIEIMNKMAKNNYKEDDIFVFNENLSNSVLAYSKEKKINYLYYDIMIKFPLIEGGKKAKLLTHRLPFIDSKKNISWTDCKDVIKQLCDKVRITIPDFRMSLPGGRLYYTRGDFTYY